MKAVFKYKTFHKSDDFELWQKENPLAVIHNIVPLLSGFKIEQTEIAKSEATSEALIFVTYFDDPK